jgi:3-oxoadipate CoA-transferase beta subunit
MDLAIGAKQTWVMMDCSPRAKARSWPCSYPLTGLGCVKRIYTDLCTLACTAEGLRLIDKVEGLEHAELERIVGLPIAA